MKNQFKYLVFIVVFFIVSFVSLPVLSKNAEEYYYDANVKLTSGDIYKAVSLYNEAVASKKDFYEAYLGLSIAYREIGDYKKAYDSIIQVLQIKPEYYQAYYNLGLILEKQGNHAEAIEAYEVFLKEVPGAYRFSDAKQRIIRLKS